MKPNDSRSFAVVKMATNGIFDFRSEFLPCVSLRDNRMAQTAGHEASITFVFAHFKDEFAHTFIISRTSLITEVRFVSAWSASGAWLRGLRSCEVLRSEDTEFGLELHRRVPLSACPHGAYSAMIRNLPLSMKFVPSE